MNIFCKYQKKIVTLRAKMKMGKKGCSYALAQ